MLSDTREGSGLGTRSQILREYAQDDTGTEALHVLRVINAVRRGSQAGRL